MSLDCISCTGHWEEKGKEQDSAAEAQSCWCCSSSPGSSGCSLPTLPQRAQPGSTLCWLPGLPSNSSGLQRHQEGRADVPSHGLGKHSCSWHPVPSCLCASPNSRTPSSCERALLIVPQKHHRGVFQSHLLNSTCL